MKCSKNYWLIKSRVRPVLCQLEKEDWARKGGGETFLSGQRPRAGGPVHFRLS